MGYLKGLPEYLEENYEKSVFDAARSDPDPWIYHLHGPQVVRARVAENLKYDVVLDIEKEGRREMQKTEIKLAYPPSSADAAAKGIKTDKAVLERKLAPINDLRHRNFVKNKSLYPLMVEREVVFFTLLEGEIVRGLIAAFSRYDITVALKGGAPATILRHGILDLRDKKGRCYLKSVQEEKQAWKKSACWIA